MTIDWNKPLMAKNGAKFRLLCTDARSKCGPVIGLLEADDDEFVSIWLENGRQSSGLHPEWDLINVPEERFAVLFRDGSMSANYPTIDDARARERTAIHGGGHQVVRLVPA